MVRHPLRKDPYHSFQCFFIERNIVRIDTEDLLLSFPTSIFQAETDITKCLVDLSADFPMNDAAPGIPASCSITLTSTFDTVSDSDGLAVSKFVLFLDAFAFAGEVLEVRHGIKAVRRDDNVVASMCRTRRS